MHQDDNISKFRILKFYENEFISFIEYLSILNVILQTINVKSVFIHQAHVYNFDGNLLSAMVFKVQ